MSIADVPGDDDDTQLRKRAGVAAGYITIVAPLPITLAVPGVAATASAIALSIFSLANLVLLARSRRFEPYVVRLISAGVVFVPVATTLSGGVTGGSASLVWGFLVPAYAILALGPRRATPWFVAFVVMVVAVVLVDPIVKTLFQPPPYALQLLFAAQNILAPLTIVFILLRYVDIRRRQAESRSQELLTNAIPPSIAVRLRHGEEHIADAYPDTTVVFADLAGFTPWTRRMDPDRVVALLDDLFGRIDERAAAHGVEKIKTVGDAYMAVAGAPEPRSDHAQAAVAFAVDLLSVMADWRAANGVDLEARVGIASGPVVGGVIGRRRLVFDLWGDTVNTAARMESSGVPGRIQVAPATLELLGSSVVFEARDVDVKGIGAMSTGLLVDGYRTSRPGG
jgi:guanylate cyclase